MRRKVSHIVVTLALLGLVSPAVAQVGKGNILIEEWFTNSTGQQVNADVTTLHNYINAGNPPDRSYWAKEMDRPDGGEDYWGDRMRGYIHPPQTGDYTFWTVSDDDSEVWLSTDESPANVTMICNVEGWENYQNWTYSTGAAGTTYKSAPVHLEAGKKYYVEVYHSDGTGGGCVTVGWGGPGIGAGPVIVDGKYLSPVIRDPEPEFLPRNPTPVDGALGVSMALMYWDAGATGVLHDVYFGADPNPPLISPMQTGLVFFWPVLEPDTTYYWKVAEVEADGVTKHAGPVWHFQSVPLTASLPKPRDGDKWIDPDVTLAWTAGMGATKHDMYFGTDRAAVAARDASVFKGLLSVPSYIPGKLEDGTTYYWVVDEHALDGSTHEGKVWSFTTMQPGTGGVKAEYFNGMTPMGAPALTRTEPSIDFNWGNDGPGAPIGVDQFSARWTADLEITVADTYTFIGRSDDGIRIWLSGDLIVDAWVDRSVTDSLSAPIALEPGVYPLRVEYYENGSGATAQVLWQTPTVARAVIPPGPLSPPVRARAMYPQDNDVNIPQDVTLMWGAGEKADQHEVYFGEDETAVAEATPASTGIYRGTQALDETTLEPGELEWNKTYYWRIDEVNDAEAESPWTGVVWSFTTADFLVVDNFETYDDVEGTNTRIYETWIDGWTNGSTSTVGNWEAPFAEQTIVHGGRQSMPLDYNNVNSPYYAEADLPLDPAQDWTVNGISDLTLYVHGRPASFAELPDGSISMSGAGTDIWDYSDEFRYAYKTLNGDGTMVARVVSYGPGSNTWAKGGVMIRATVDPASNHAFMPLTGSAGNGASWQRRLIATDASANSDAPSVIAPPYWVKVERKGNDFSGYVSPDGVTWTQLGPTETINMATSALIGLAVTSHASGELRSFTFDNVSMTGTVTGNWTVAEIGVAQPANSPGELYVTLTDSSNKTATVMNPDVTVALSEDWTEWKIPLSSFTDVNASRVKQLTIGIGDKTPDGNGRIYIDDIRVTKPAPEPAE